MTVTLCIPTLNRYDLLVKALESAEKGSLVPDRYLVIDNGGRLKLNFPKLEIVHSPYNIGVAKSWNYFIKATDEIRIISNDDIIFGENCLKNLVEQRDEKGLTGVYGLDINAFSLFTISDYVVDKVGYFDEQLSPNYAYFEDNDYIYRCSLEKIYLSLASSCDLTHVGSATINALRGEQKTVHNKKFELAKSNYLSKWGGLPTKEKFMKPFNGEKHAYKL